MDVSDDDGFTPLHLAAWEGNPEVIEKLHGLGANLEATDKRGATPMHAAANYGRLVAVMMLHELGASLESMDKQGLKPAELAAKNNHKDIIIFYLQKNPKELEKLGLTMNKTKEEPEPTESTTGAEPAESTVSTTPDSVNITVKDEV